MSLHDPEFLSKEKTAGSKAAGALRSAVRSQIKTTFNRRSGNMEKSNVLPRYKEGRLDRLVLTSPHYSFQDHFGSSKTGATAATSRKGGKVKSFSRHVKGVVQQVQAHVRSGGSVAAHRKGIHYKAYDHIAAALRSTNALEQLATDLGENRIVQIASQIDFK